MCRYCSAHLGTRLIGVVRDGAGNFLFECVLRKRIEYRSKELVSCAAQSLGAFILALLMRENWLQ
jgi:hypothetical protein